MFFICDCLFSFVIIIMLLQKRVNIKENFLCFSHIRYCKGLSEQRLLPAKLADRSLTLFLKHEILLIFFLML